jgi:subtilisin family serine protease
MLKKSVLFGSFLVFATHTFAAGLQEPSQLKPVLVLYKRAQIANPLFLGAEARAQLIHFLQTRTGDLQTQVLAQISNPSSIQSLWLVQGSLVSLTNAEIRTVAANPNVDSISEMNARAHLVKNIQAPERLLKTDFTYGLEKIGVPQLRSAEPGRTGHGVRVGILDTGIDAQHEALVGKVKIFKDFTALHAKVAYDDHGHGTHVAGTIAGGVVSNESIGVAPGAQLIIGKVFDKDGNSTDQGLLLGMQWMTDPDGTGSAQSTPWIVSNSWTVDAKPIEGDPATSPFCIAAETWRKLGIIPVFAAGNDGPDASTVDIPAACPQVISVAATDDQDQVAEFSSRGPVLWKSLRLNKPDISAPGVDIDSAAAGGGTAVKSGTSMAAPHVAGALALLLQGQGPTHAEQARKALLQGADDLGPAGFDFDYGIGRVNVVRSASLMKVSQ